MQAEAKAEVQAEKEASKKVDVDFLKVRDSAYESIYESTLRSATEDVSAWPRALRPSHLHLPPPRLWQAGCSRPQIEFEYAN